MKLEFLKKNALELIGTPNRAKLHSCMIEILCWSFSLNKIQWQALGYRFIEEWTAIQRLVRDCTRFYRQNSIVARIDVTRNLGFTIQDFCLVDCSNLLFNKNKFSSRELNASCNSRFNCAKSIQLVDFNFDRLVSVATLILLRRKFRNLQNSNHSWAIIYQTITHKQIFYK